MLALLVLLVAVVLFGAAFYFVGGVPYVTSLISGGAPAKSASAAATSTVPSATATATSDEFARRMYVEQLESHAVLQRMAQGQVESLVVKHVDVSETSATIEVLATFTDGTYADGLLSMVKQDGDWYFFSLTGMRKPGVTGLSESVASFATEETSHTIEAAADALGVKTFDSGVINTLMSEQSSHQELVKAILGGTYNAINFGGAKRGIGNVTLPITLTGPGAKTAQGDVVLIDKTIDGQPRTFLTTIGQ